MKKALPQFSVSLTVFSVTLFLLHHFSIVWLKKEFFYPTWSIYTFLAIATFLIYLFLLFVHKAFPDKTGFAFLACGLLKMFASVVFLIPLLQAGVKNPVPDVLNFFIPYFLFLLYETIYAVRLINIK